MIDILKEAKLIKVQRNEIYETIIDNSFTPESFLIEGTDWHNREEITVILLNFKEDKRFGFSLNIGSDFHKFWGKYSPGERIFEVSYQGEWITMLESLARWLKSLKAELELEEKWERLYLTTEDVKFIETEDEKFTTEEIEIIDKKLDQFKKRILLLEIPEEAKTELVEKADDLKEQTKILSKVNWQQLFIGVIVNTVMRLSLTRESAALIWNTVKTFFSNLILLP